ncbi:hypothetical protein BH20ACT5_BH20ACT5_19410 [soil metagenome]
MEPIVSAVKGRRRYDASGRREQARRNRQAVLDVAQQRFLDDGYAATTVAAVAGAAGVSVDTIYKAFGGKPGLVRALYERGLTGHGPVPAYHRSDAMREREVDPRTILRNWGALTAEVASTVNPIRLLVRAAADTDPDMAALVADSNADRLRRMRHNARALAERGFLRDGVTPAQAADIMWTCSSPEFFELLVLRRGWSLRRFGRYVGDCLIAGLLPE